MGTNVGGQRDQHFCIFQAFAAGRFRPFFRNMDSREDFFLAGNIRVSSGSTSRRSVKENSILSEILVD